MQKPAPSPNLDLVLRAPPGADKTPLSPLALPVRLTTTVMASWAPRKGGSIAADYRTPRRKGRDCRNMKLLGSCVHEAKCRFNHDVDSEQTYVIFYSNYTV